MYLEIDEGFPGHRKTLRLCTMLQNPEAGWYMIRLWSWACRSCPDGSLRGLTPYDIEMAVQYRKLDGACYRAMADSGYIDEEPTGEPSEIHDWMEHTGGAIKRMGSAANSKKLWRLHRDRKCGRNCKWCRDVQGQSKDSPRTATGQNQDKTAQDKTRQDQSSQDKTSPVKTRPEDRNDPDLDQHQQSNGELVLTAPKAKKGIAPSEAFAEFWAAYPRHVAKQSAIKAWPGDELLPAILAALEWQAPEFRKREQDKIPHPATWLNGKRWEDEKPHQQQFPSRQPDPSRGHFSTTSEQPQRTGRLELP